MIKLIKYILPVLILTLFSCNILKKNNKDLTNKEESKYIYHFSEANKYRLLGNNEKAIENYLSAIETKPGSAVSNFYLATLFSSQNKHETAILFANQAVKLSPENFWYRLAKADILNFAGNKDEAKKIYEDLLKEKPGNDLLFERLEKLYSEENIQNELQKLYENYLKRNGFDNDIALKLYDVYRKESEFAKAESILKKIIDFNPESPKYKALLAEYYIGINNIDKAEQVYTELLNNFPDNNEIILSYAYYCKYSGKKDEYFNNVFKLMSSEFDLTIKINLLISGQYPNFPEKEYVQLINELYKYHSSEFQANTLFAEYYIDKNDIKRAIFYVKKATEIEKNNFNLILTLFELYYDDEDYTSLYNASKNYLLVYPNRPKVFLYNGLAAYKLEKLNQAIEALSIGTDLIINDDKLEIQFNYYLAESHKKLKDYKNSDKFYEKTIAINSKYYPALLSYSINLSLRKINLDKAESLAKTCFDNNNNDPAFIYAYALALYRSMKYNEALNISKKFNSETNKNPVYLELIGDIYFVNNNKKEAVSFWKLAKDNNSKSIKLDHKLEDVDNLNNEDL